MRVEQALIPTPVGELLVAASPAGLCLVDFDPIPSKTPSRLLRQFGSELVLTTASDPAGVVSRLNAYFEGALDALNDIPLDLHGTPFQRIVWTALRDIPAGTTWSYSGLAAKVARPRAVRAVGAANGANPVPLVLPCHRVIGSDGTLTGFGGGLPRKEWLLRHEGASFRGSVGPTPSAQLSLPGIATA